jgi:ribosomal protein S12 methylthiotransferase accessory factor YcaO
MLLRPLGESPPALQARFDQALETLEGLQADEQLEVACQMAVGILKAARPCFEGSPGDQAAYNALCAAVTEWFQDEITPLRFARRD